MLLYRIFKTNPRKKGWKFFSTLYNCHYEKIGNEIRNIEDEIPFEIPDTWAWCRINNYVEKVTDFVASGSFASLRENVKYYKTENYALLVKTQDFANNFTKDLTYTDKHGYDFLSNSNIFGGELILSNVGSIGKVFIVPQLNRFATLAPNSIMVRCFNVKHIMWIYNLFRSDYGLNLLLSISSATAIKKFNKTDFKTLLVPIPPLQEQARIVSEIEKYEPLIAEYYKLEQQKTKLDSGIYDNLKKSILQYAIQGKLVPQDSNDEPASVLLEKIRAEKKLKLGKKYVESYIYKGDDNCYYEHIGGKDVNITEEISFDLPNTWSWVRFPNIANFELGKTPDRHTDKYWSNGLYPWFSIADMHDKQVVTNCKEKISAIALKEKFSNACSPAGTLIMSFKLTVGRTSILGIDAVHNEAIISIFPYVNTNNITRDYLMNTLGLLVNYVEQTDAIKGATLNSNKLKSMFVPLPPLAEQKRIVNKIDEIFSKL